MHTVDTKAIHFQNEQIATNAKNRNEKYNMGEIHERGRTKTHTMYMRKRDKERQITQKDETSHEYVQDQ